MQDDSRATWTAASYGSSRVATSESPRQCTGLHPFSTLLWVPAAPMPATATLHLSSGLDCNYVCPGLTADCSDIWSPHTGGSATSLAASAIGAELFTPAVQCCKSLKGSQAPPEPYTSILTHAQESICLLCIIHPLASNPPNTMSLRCWSRYNIGTTVGLADQFPSVSISASMQVSHHLGKDPCICLFRGCSSCARAMQDNICFSHAISATASHLAFNTFKRDRRQGH